MMRQVSRWVIQATGWRTEPLSDSAAYRQWRRHFLRHRLRLSLGLALAAYMTFTLLQIILDSRGQSEWDDGRFGMAIASQVCLLGCLMVLQTSWGRRHPEWVFLAGSWSITLTEQMWASFRGEAFVGLFSWTLVFLVQSTLMPVRWPLHMVSQLGVAIYYLGVNGLWGFANPDAAYWRPSLWLYLLWFCLICNLAVFLYERLKRNEFYARQALEAERSKSERLLLNILPEPVARQLKLEHRTIAEHFPEVTVLFADIVGFTQLSAGIPPDEIVQLLNQIFSAFDHLAERHGLEKIKTIGDAYMVVGGLPLEQANHVEAIADMALDMNRAIAQFNSRTQQAFRMRMGIHTGPVVAGVIGVKKFIYDLWGDTVNIASRMESQGVPAGIQVTAAVYERLKDRYLLEERGPIYVKGKGEMVTYLLKGKLAALLPTPR